MKVAVLTLAHGRHDHLCAQHESLTRGSRVPDDYLVVAMGDPSQRPQSVGGLERRVLHLPADRRRLPLAAARNAGVARLLDRGADVVVLLDVDCLAGRDLVTAYAVAVSRRPEAVWSGPVTYLSPAPPGGYALDGLDTLDDPHPARPDPGRGRELLDVDPAHFWSLSFALSAATWRQAGGFCEDYDGYGGEDTDFGRRVVECGGRHAVSGDARAYHQWHPVSSPPVEHLDDVLRNAATFHARWGEWPMLGWLRAFEEQGLVELREGRWERSTI